jgi:3-methyladenine DNA glycosylase/8-oxoguanine DNA glycosylase
MARNLEKAAGLNIRIPAPFDFALTVAKPAGWHWSTPTEVFEDGTLWTAFYLGAKPLGVRMSSRGDGRVNAGVYSASGLGEKQIERLRAALEFGLGKHQDIEAFYRFAQKDPILRRVVRDRYGMRIARLDELFGRVILAITLQMARTDRSRQMMRDVLSLYGTAVRFDGRRVVLWPTVRKIARLDPAELRDRANMGYRARLLSQAARYLADNPMSVMDLDVLPDEEAIEKVRAIPGIGQYAAGIVLGRYAPVDAWSVIVMSELLFGHTPERPRDEIERVNELIHRRWGKWSWLAFAYILNDLDNLSTQYDLTRLT